MIERTRRFVILTALLLGACSAPRAEPRSPAQQGSETSDPVDDYIRSVMEKGHVPGAAVAVVRDGNIEKMAVYGVADLESSAKVELETPFQIASATKIFTATLVMLLVQEGKLGLGDPVSRYLPDAPETWKAITIRHLAAHASGIHDDPGDLSDPTASIAERYEVARKTPLDSQPGDRSQYGLTDFVVLTHVLEKVTGERFEELLERRVFQPLGFTCTRFEHARQEGAVRVADIIPRRATTYRFTDGAQKRAWFLYPERTYASGGAFSCVKDLARWAVAMDRGALLAPESQRIAATAFRLNDGRNGGFGVVFGVGAVRGSPSFGHSGGPALADVLRVPEKRLSVIVLTNQQRLHPAIAPNVAALYLPPLPALDEPGIADTDPAVSQALREIVDGMASGIFEETTFAQRARGELLPALRAWSAPYGAVYPEPRRMVLLEDSRSGEERRRVYRVVHGKDITVRWSFTLDAAGKVLDLSYEME